ncbi:M36 family metallopeptidase [Marinicella sp. W31]|uniref:M36 family metallopeptidase n=1 Tax=Marinicella sp. W31 TaxID=3023713 RepID=UPI0037577093
MKLWQNLHRFSVCLASVLMLLIAAQAAARIPIEGQIEDIIAFKHKLPYSDITQTQDKVHNFLPIMDDRIQQSWRKSSSVKTPEGVEIIKFLNSYNGIPVHGDWASVVFDKLGDAVEMSYRLTQPNENGLLALKNSQRYWLHSSQQMALGFSNKNPSLKLYSPMQAYWFEQGQQLIPAYKAYVIVQEQGLPKMYAYLFNAEDAQVLTRFPVTYEATYGYRVYADEGGYPLPDVYGMNQPHPFQKANGFFPASTVEQNLVFVDEFSETSDDPWLDANASETAGNNVDVFFNSLLLPGIGYDGSFEGGAYGPEFQPQDGDFRARLNGDTFDYVYNPSISSNDFYQFPEDPNPRNPSPNDAQINAKLVQGFYMANFMRDMFYDAGFTEAAGNAQQDNFGRGGIGNDRMIIHGNCNSTFIFTPEDGVQPVMCLGLNTSSGSRQDAGLELSLFAHEWGHYIYRRLVDGPIEVAQNQSRSLNEGVADFLGVFMNVREEHITNTYTTIVQEGIVGVSAPAFSSSYAVGSYFNVDYIFQPFFDLNGTDPEPYFYGIRRWPYGPGNPLSFRHVEHQQPLPEGFAFFDWKGRSKFNAEYHSAGEIWGAVLWDCYRSLLYNRTDRSFVDNRKAMAAYLVAGLQATPPNPNYTEARDGLLKAVRLADERDWLLFRRVMASRGLGSGAIAPAKDSRGSTGVVESFTNHDLYASIIDIQLDDSTTSLDGDGILDSGERGFVSLMIKNTGFLGIDRATVALLPSTDYTPIGNVEIDVASIQQGEQTLVRLPVEILHNRHYDATLFEVQLKLFSADDTVYEYSTATQHRTHFDLVSSNEIETFDYAEQLSVWSQDEILQHPYTDTAWKQIDIKGDRMMQIGETHARYQVALVSPWLRSGNGDLRLAFDHSYDLSESSPQFGFVEYTLDEEQWRRIENTSGNAIIYRDVADSYPLMQGQFLVVPDVLDNTDFKIRFRSTAITSYLPEPTDWRIDNVRVSGITNQPFVRVVKQQVQP